MVVTPLVNASHILVNILDVLLWREELVQVGDGGLKLCSEQRLSLLPLLLLDKVQTDDWGTVATKASKKVEASRIGKWE